MYDLARADGRICCRNCVHDPGGRRLCRLANIHVSGHWRKCPHYQVASAATIAERREAALRSRYKSGLLPGENTIIWRPKFNGEYLISEARAMQLKAAYEERQLKKRRAKALAQQARYRAQIETNRRENERQEAIRWSARAPGFIRLVRENRQPVEEYRKTGAAEPTLPPGPPDDDGPKAA